MKATPLKRFLASIVTAALLISNSIFSVFAGDTQTYETVKGEEETVEVNQTASADRENNFNKDWKFHLGTSSTAYSKDFDDSSWKNVDLPHDFSIIQSYTSSGEAESGFLPGGTGWYRKSFTMPADAEGKTILLNFDGVYMNATVYVNGTELGTHNYGYTSFAFDISDYLTYDGATENVVAVKAVNTIPSSRWYSGSGIYRDVTLIVADSVHVDLNGVYVTTPDIASGSGIVNVKTEIVNDRNTSVSATVTNTVYRKGSETPLANASATSTVSAGSTNTVTTSPVVSNPALWSIDSPNLYVVKTEVSVNGEVVDTYETEFGFRWFSFDSQGFHLNGENIKLNGVCMHHDQGALGSAAYYDAMYRQLSIMKDMGCNAIRTAHNPADEDYIKICNELGLLVIEEAFDGLVDPKNENSYDFSRYFESDASSELYGYDSGMTCAEYAARSMVRRDRNAPSIIAWSFGNEIQEGTYWNNVSRYDDICADFINWVNGEDGTRPVTIGDNNRGGDSRIIDVLNTIINADGIIGFNYANSASTLYSLAQSYGGDTGCIIASETSSATNSRGQYKNQYNNSNSDGKYHLTSYDTSSVSWGITAHDSIYNTYQYDCVAGEFVWTGFDYLGEPTPWNGTTSGDSGRGAIPNSSYFGIVETTGFEKDTYYLYRSQWNKEETTLHLVTAWDSDNMMTSSSKTPVWVYSNAPVVKLYRDGTLIGTATREANTSSAGHTYYTYTTTSNNSSICTTSFGYGADALYAVFNVAFTSGTLSAKAFEADGTTEIALTGNSGKNTVTTPGSVSKLAVSQNKYEIAADGSSLVYIEVDVTDANGNPDTTAANKIQFSLTGDGEIVGVDNGDQATKAKYQQSSVLTGTNSANINAYAGKALAIVRSTEESGSFTVNVTSSGLIDGEAVVITTPVSEETTAEGLVSYTMVKDYTVKAGTTPDFDTTAKGVLADGSVITGNLVWNFDADYSEAGDYTVNGTLTFNGFEPIAVTARLHVIADIIALRNVSAVTSIYTVPVLPSVVSGVRADGTVSGEYVVNWENVSESDFANVGELVVVNGTAVIFGDEMLPVTCTVRVAQAVQTESTNVAPLADSLTQDIASYYQSDNLASIRNGTLKPGDNTSERWTNWNNRTRSEEATLTLTWATAQMLSGVNLYYYYDNCCAYPEAIEFSYSLNGQDYTVINAAAEEEETYYLGAMYSYTFENPINPVGLKVKFTQQDGTSGNHCVGLTELEVMTYTASLEYNTSADLSGITVDGTAVEGFAADTLAYTAAGTTVAASTAVNAGITILPAQDNVVRILTVSEDGSAYKMYEITLEAAIVCDHVNTEIKNAAETTCITDGYTGDKYCDDCRTVIEAGSVIPAPGHKFDEWTVTTAATCEVNGEQTRTCTVEGCGVSETEVIAATGHSYGEWEVTTAAACEVEGEQKRMCENCGVSETEAIPALDHQWDNGIVTQEPTEVTTGVKTYTCSACGATKTEEIPALTVEKTAPTVSVSAERGSSNKIKMIGIYNDYANKDNYYDDTDHGLIYYTASRLGSKVLTVNTPGRTKYSFTKYSGEGSFSYQMRVSNKNTKYVVRAYVAYRDENTGLISYSYSDPITVSYNSLG